MVEKCPYHKIRAFFMRSIQRFPSTLTSSRGEKRQSEIQLDHNDINDVDEESAYHGHHQERYLRRPVALRHRLHVSDGSWRGPQSKTAVSCRQYSRIVVTTHDPERHENRKQRHDQRLCRQDDKDRQSQCGQIPEFE